MRRPRAAAAAAGAAVAVLAATGGIVAAVQSGGGGTTHAAPPAASPATTASSTPTTPAATTTAAPTSTTHVAPPSTAEDAALRAHLEAALTGRQACLVVADGSSGRVVYARGAGVPLSPASTIKLVVGAAALDLLGPSYRFTTTVVSAGTPAGGALGDVWLVGSGDPLLASPEYAAHLATDRRTPAYPTTPIASLADQLTADGVRHIGAVHGDDGRFEELRYLPAWPQQDIVEGDVGPLGALEVDQSLTSWTPPRIAPDPTALGAAVLARLLGERGVAAGAGADAFAPAHSVVLARVVSAPLSDIVTAMLRASDNQVAELLVREIDRQGGGNGTTAGGLARVVADARRLGLPVAGLQLFDGSGLAPADRATCPLLMAALALGSQPRFGALAAGLPVAGAPGTLVNRFVGTPAAGHLAAKTGNIQGAVALAGHIDVTRPFTFALIVNGLTTYPDGVAVENLVVQALSVG